MRGGTGGGGCQKESKTVRTTGSIRADDGAGSFAAMWKKDALFGGNEEAGVGNNLKHLEIGGASTPRLDLAKGWQGQKRR